jgi:hypothetical protein
MGEVERLVADAFGRVFSLAPRAVSVETLGLEPAPVGG